MAKQRTLTKAEVLEQVEVAKEELDKIPTGKGRARLRGFMDFIRQQGVIGLAIGLVIGTQVKVLVDQMIISFVDPLLGLVIGGGGTLREKVFSIHIDRFGKSAEFAWGAFVYVLIDFVIIAAIIYFVFKGLKLDRLDKKKDT